eukprot:SM000127S26669  [mRNA]  locus=s127:281794:289592:- [translate_table: standard]
MAPLTAYELQRQARLAAAARPPRIRFPASSSSSSCRHKRCLPPAPRGERRCPALPPGAPPAVMTLRECPRALARLAEAQEDYREPSAGAASQRQAQPRLAGSTERRRQKLQPGECNLPESYTREHQRLLGSAAPSWQLNKDGFAPDGKTRVYDSLKGRTCHQCRQKTLGQRTTCSECKSVRGRSCGDCLFMRRGFSAALALHPVSRSCTFMHCLNTTELAHTLAMDSLRSFGWRPSADSSCMLILSRAGRYGENVLEAQANKDWMCLVCRDMCNCSFCESHKSWAPTAQLYRKVVAEGYTSVAHYLVLTQQVCRAEEPSSSESGATQNEAPEFSSSPSPDYRGSRPKGRWRGARVAQRPEGRPARLLPSSPAMAPLTAYELQRQARLAAAARPPRRRSPASSSSSSCRHKRCLPPAPRGERRCPALPPGAPPADWRELRRFSLSRVPVRHRPSKLGHSSPAAARGRGRSCDLADASRSCTRASTSGCWAAQPVHGISTRTASLQMVRQLSGIAHLQQVSSQLIVLSPSMTQGRHGQKALGQQNTRSKCKSLRGQICGNGLFMRYGEDVLKAQANKDWVCPDCQDICNCSFCRSHKGWAPTGQLYRKEKPRRANHYKATTLQEDAACQSMILLLTNWLHCWQVVGEGYTSVAHYLVLTQQGCQAEESMSSESGVTQDETPEDSSSSSPDLA